MAKGPLLRDRTHQAELLHKTGHLASARKLVDAERVEGRHTRRSSQLQHNTRGVKAALQR